jgi:hypothetical protein
MHASNYHQANDWSLIYIVYASIHIIFEPYHAKLWDCRQLVSRLYPIKVTLFTLESKQITSISIPMGTYVETYVNQNTTQSSHIFFSNQAVGMTCHVGSTITLFQIGIPLLWNWSGVACLLWFGIHPHQEQSWAASINHVHIIRTGLLTCYFCWWLIKLYTLYQPYFHICILSCNTLGS